MTQPVYQTFNQERSLYVAPAVQTSTNAYVIVAGSTLDTANGCGKTIMYQISETGNVNGINAKVRGSLDNATWNDLIGWSQNGALNGLANIAISNGGTGYIGISPSGNNGILSAFRYYSTWIESSNTNNSGIAQVFGLAKA